MQALQLPFAHLATVTKAMERTTSWFYTMTENTENTEADSPSRRVNNLTRGQEVIRRVVATLPLAPGVYRMLAADGAVLYVGKAKELKKRVANYTQIDRLPGRLKRMVAETYTMEIVTTHTEVEALLLETNLIKQLTPKYNILMRDDKMFPYIALTKGDDFPRVIKYRGAMHKKAAEYFGPFASSGAVNRALIDLQKSFQLRVCSDQIFNTRKRPCLQYHIKRCTAPCVGYVDKEGYAAQVAEAREFLSGDSRDLQERYADEMQAASDALDFEHAARMRDRIRTLNEIQAAQDINIPDIGTADVFGAANKGGQVGIHVVLFRQGRNYGARTFFPRHDVEESTAEVLAGFIMQFYVDQPPPRQLLLSEPIPESHLVEQALAEAAQAHETNYKVALSVPQRGDRKRLIDFAVRNADEALARRLAERDVTQALLVRLTELFQLPNLPQRIEVYDNSHIGGASAVGGMVVAGPEGFRKNAYRKFNIKAEQTVGENTRGGDDFGMIREVFRRRFAKSSPGSDDWPDLVLIDGGKGQLSSAIEALAEHGIAPDQLALVAIAKGPDRDAGREDFYRPVSDGKGGWTAAPPFKLPPTDPLLYYLQRLRDEVHRFAIGSHRIKRGNDMLKNPLDDMPGIGPARRRALMRHFGSAAGVKAAAVVDIAKVPGISPAMAQKIYGYFH